MSTSSHREKADRAALVRAQRLSDQARYGQSNEILREIIAEGGPSPYYRAKLYGLLGLNHHWLGQTEAALRCTREALNAATSAADAEGMRIYRVNLLHLETKGQGTG